MKEIGGYLELDTYNLPLLHEGAVALNCGRNCLAYLIEARNIKKICLPYFLCDSVRNICKKYNLNIRYYHITEDFKPYEIDLDDDEWLYLVNYYGQVEREYLEKLSDNHKNIIVDNAQAYFDEPIENVDTIYTCRKFFGVSDGAFLYTNAELKKKLLRDESFERINFLLGRFERTASEFYALASANNSFFANEPIKKMSKLTENLLRGIDYELVKKKRTENYNYLAEMLQDINHLHVKEIDGAYMYPLMIENSKLMKKKLLDNKIYIPILWPNIINDMSSDTLEWKYANNILPIPCDQRYSIEDMKWIISNITAINNTLLKGL